MAKVGLETLKRAAETKIPFVAVLGQAAGWGENRDPLLNRALVLAIDNAWPAHHFDSMLDEAAIEIGIKGLDIAVYRNKRLERWQDLVACFHSPEEAREGLRRAIRAELVMVFGSA
ncbi:hypothetical protein [Sphingosinicella sp. YJ22]|uniref:hypothetical protein n=1 Tax=Sphingosinicella sp. YJ22 TaxID=1104780 RepID=UPI00140C44B0|nr:hypothetical protein [Sphingosinicella sp. YJ22]